VTAAHKFVFCLIKTVLGNLKLKLYQRWMLPNSWIFWNKHEGCFSRLFLSCSNELVDDYLQKQQILTWKPWCSFTKVAIFANTSKSFH